MIRQSFYFVIFLKPLRVFQLTCKYDEYFVVSKTCVIIWYSVFFSHVMVTLLFTNAIKIMEII